MLAEADWQRIWAVFHRARELVEGERGDCVRAELADHPALISEVLSLLAAEPLGDDFLESPPSLPQSDDDSLLGQHLGRYRIESILGKGGMGSVFLARDSTALNRPVALKLVRRGMDSDRIIARFELERQTLALMQHPNIAAVHDAGASAVGRPYLVMERVSGDPIDRYADAEGLDTSARLRLFLQLCAAVAHAHMKGVIHRDLKPSNVLVDGANGAAVVKVIDFGVAKIIGGDKRDSDTLTEVGQAIGTPEYMSPEQALAAPGSVDTRSDVYALGVLLFKLLVGELPYSVRPGSGLGPPPTTPADTREPPSPSERLRRLDPETAARIAAQRRCDAPQLRRELRGELDWIVTRAMAIEPARRYQSAAELAADIERFLQHRPIFAAAPGLGYRARKFVRRHRFGTAMSGVLLLLVAGFSYGLWTQVRETRQALARAEQERARAEQVSQFLIDVFENSDPEQTQGADLSLRRVLDNGADQLREARNLDAAVRAQLMQTVAKVYQRLGLLDPAADLQRRALAVRELQLPEDVSGKADALTELAIIQREQGQLEDAEISQRAALALYLELGQSFSAEQARAHLLLALLLRVRGDPAAARAELLEAIAIYDQRALPEDAAERAAVSNALAGVHQDAGELQAALQRYREVLAFRQQAQADDVLMIANARNNLGSVLIRLGDYPQAEQEFRAVVEVYRQIYGERHPATATALNNLAVSLNQQGQAGAAVPLLQNVLAIRRELLGDDHPEVAVTRYNLGRASFAMGQASAAVAEYRQVLPAFERSYGADHARIAIVANALAQALIELDQISAAAEVALRADTIAARQWPQGHEVHAAALTHLAEIARQHQDLDRAEALARRAQQMQAARVEADDWRLAAVDAVLGAILIDQGRPDAARPLLVAAAARLQRQFGAEDPRARRANQALHRIERATAGRASPN